MRLESHTLIGKIVQLNPSTISNWWVDCHYTDYEYRVERIVRQHHVQDGKLIAHVLIHRKLPGKEGREQLERRSRIGNMFHILVDDLMPVHILKNIDAARYLSKE